MHPGEIRYSLLWPLHNYPLALLGSIPELESCEQKHVQSSRFGKKILQDVCMLENREPSYLPLTLILDPGSMMLVFSSSFSYMMTTLTIAGEMLPPCSSLSHDINVIVLNMHPHTWMSLT